MFLNLGWAHRTHWLHVCVHCNLQYTARNQSVIRLTYVSIATSTAFAFAAFFASPPADLRLRGAFDIATAFYKMAAVSVTAAGRATQEIQTWSALRNKVNSASALPGYTVHNRSITWFPKIFMKGNTLTLHKTALAAHSNHIEI